MNKYFRIQIAKIFYLLFISCFMESLVWSGKGICKNNKLLTGYEKNLLKIWFLTLIVAVSFFTYIRSNRFMFFRINNLKYLKTSVINKYSKLLIFTFFFVYLRIRHYAFALLFTIFRSRKYFVAWSHLIMVTLVL